jgi:general stress protein YciG
MSTGHRARARAETLSRAGLEALGVVVGKTWAPEAGYLAGTLGVAWYIEGESPSETLKAFRGSTRSFTPTIRQSRTKPMSEQTPTMRDASRLGGARLKALHGPERFRRIGRLGGLKSLEKGPEYFRELGRKGGAKNREKGPEYFRRISLLAAEARRPDPTQIGPAAGRPPARRPPSVPGRGPSGAGGRPR